MTIGSDSLKAGPWGGAFRMALERIALRLRTMLQCGKRNACRAHGESRPRWRCSAFGTKSVRIARPLRTRAGARTRARGDPFLASRVQPSNESVVVDLIAIPADPDLPRPSRSGCRRLFVFLPMGVARLTGAHNPNAEKLSEYECGFPAFEDPRSQFDVRFYLIAILFIVFDLEAAFLFPWAVSLDVTGWPGWITMMVFLFELAVGLAYAWKKGALEWE